VVQAGGVLRLAAQAEGALRLAAQAEGALRMAAQPEGALGLAPQAAGALGLEPQLGGGALPPAPSSVGSCARICDHQGSGLLGTREGNIGTRGGCSRSRPSPERVWRGFEGLGGLVGKNDLCRGRGWSGVYICWQARYGQKTDRFLTFFGEINDRPLRSCAASLRSSEHLMQKFVTCVLFVCTRSTWAHKLASYFT
jgi:hypothetical protein